MNALEALLAAAQSERESLRQYLLFAWKTRDPGGRAMFIRLALDEYSHMELVEGQAREREKIGRLRPVELPKTIIETLVPKLSDRSRRIRGTTGQSDLAALETALDLERRAVALYREQVQIAGEDEAKQMFERLAEMEEAHSSLIQAELDNIQRDGYWFDIQEFTLEGQR